MKSHLIPKDITLLEALAKIGSLPPEPLVLFVMDEENRMVGTLTDGDSRRALIAGASVNDKVEKIMHRNFNYMRADDIDNVLEIRRQKQMQMRLVPILDQGKHIVDIIDLSRCRTRLPVDAVLMAGGKGERLRPLTEHTPKPLLRVGDKAIIDHNVDRLITYGINHISVTVNYLGEQLEDHFRLPREGVQIQTVKEPRFLGTIGSILLVKEFSHDSILVMNSDLFTTIDYEDFYLHFKEHDADMSVVAVPYNVSVPLGIFELDGRNITGLKEKPKFDFYANAGIYLIKKSVLDFIPENREFHSTDLIETLIAHKKKVIRFPLNGTWMDIGTPQEYKRANDLVKYLHW